MASHLIIWRDLWTKRLQGCPLRSLYGPRRAHLLLYWYFDGLALRTLPLIFLTKIIAE